MNIYPSPYQRVKFRDASCFKNPAECNSTIRQIGNLRYGFTDVNLREAQFTGVKLSKSG
jgi:hypothetical protein